MRIANVNGRSTLLGRDGAGLDVEKASGGKFPADPQALFAQWDEFSEWAPGRADRADSEVDAASVGAPAPLPTQIFGIGLNYADHVVPGTGRPSSLMTGSHQAR